MSTITTVTDLLVEELKNLHSAEVQMEPALLRLMQAATDPDLATLLQRHLEETREHASRLDYIGRQLGRTLTGRHCEAMKGLVTACRRALQENADPHLHDLALIAAAQRIEHYEIAAYRAAGVLAQTLGEGEVEEMLQSTLAEESLVDRELSEMATSLLARAEQHQTAGV